MGVRVEVPSSAPMLLLKESDGQRYLPIWIGPWEANAIALKLQGVSPERPLTHDLFARTLQELGEFRGEYERALRVNHPSYDPDRYSD